MPVQAKRLPASCARVPLHLHLAQAVWLEGVNPHRAPPVRGHRENLARPLHCTVRSIFGSGILWHTPSTCTPTPSSCTCTFNPYLHLVGLGSTCFCI